MTEQLRGMYCVSVHPTRVNYYYEPLNRHVHHNTHSTSHDQDTDLAKGFPAPNNSVASIRPSQFRDNYHHGKISKIAERKISRAIDYITYLAQPKRLPHTKHGKGLSFRLNFITLTLSHEQIHTDHEIMLRIFSPFLNSLRQKWNVTNYIWRAERQASGGIHYHIITDRFIPWSELRSLWNNCQQHLGYVTRYRNAQLAWHKNGFVPRPELYKNWPLRKQKEHWEKRHLHDWNSPNSTDVHSLRLITNVKAYFKKYMTKEGQNSNIEGRLWGCSQLLSNIKGAQAAVYSSIDDDLGKLQADKSLKVFSTDYFTIILVTPADLVRLQCHEILHLFDVYIASRWQDHPPPLRFTT